MVASTSCPNCGASRVPEATDCPTCGIVYAKYRGPRPATPAAGPIASTAPTLSQPAAPVAEPGVSGGVWRRGRTLVVDRLATLPNRCVSCNEPAESRLSRRLYWHASWVYIFVFLNVILYVLIASVFRKTAQLDIPLCARHLKIRRYGILAAWALLGLGTLVAWMSVAATADGPISAVPMLVFFGSALVALIVGFTVSRPVVATRIDDDFVWLAKCSRSFLLSVPEEGTNEPALGGTSG